MKLFDNDIAWYIILFIFSLAICLCTFRNKIETLKDRITFLEKSLNYTKM